MSILILKYAEFIRSPSNYYLKSYKRKTKDLTFAEIMLISWLLYMIATLYIFIDLNINKLNNLPWKYIIHLMACVFYPIILWFQVIIWEFIIKIASQIMLKDNIDYDSSIKQIIHQSLISNIFLIIPFFGHIISFIFFTYYMIIGLKYRLRMTTINAIISLTLPTTFIIAIISIIFIFIISTIGELIKFIPLEQLI